MTQFDRVLILETAGRIGQVALAAQASIIAEVRLAEARRRASDLTVAVSELLKGQGWSARQLTAVVVGLGPGSYTGLRVGLASAKVLAYATGCRFFGVETFAAIVARAPPDVRRAWVIGDALQGKLFARPYERIGDWQPAGPLEVIEAGRWRERLSPGTWVGGPAGDGEFHEPRPMDLLMAARSMPWAVTTDPWTAEPLYLRGSSAEEKAAGRA